MPQPIGFDYLYPREIGRPPVPGSRAPVLSSKRRVLVARADSRYALGPCVPDEFLGRSFKAMTPGYWTSGLATPSSGFKGAEGSPGAPVV